MKKKEEPAPEEPKAHLKKIYLQKLEIYLKSNKMLNI
jgi:hypothetical protein